MGDSDDQRWMREAVALARQCPPSRTAFSVGAIVVGADGAELSRGFSREGGDPVVHAEEAALGKLAVGDPRLAGATIYSTLEPCSQRKSRPRTCAQLIIAAGLARVVIAWREPALFVADCTGYELLADAGIAVSELPEFAVEAAAPNSHLIRLLPRQNFRPKLPSAPQEWVEGNFGARLEALDRYQTRGRGALSALQGTAGCARPTPSVEWDFGHFLWVVTWHTATGR